MSESDTVFDLSKSYDGLFSYFGRQNATKILSAFDDFVKEFDDDGCQDSFRIRVVSYDGTKFDNSELYYSLVTCCGYTDREYVFDFLPDWVLEFGCNYGH